MSSFAFSAFTSADDNIYNLSLEELQNLQVQIATKTQTQIRHAPATVSYFSRQEIELLGIETLVELFAYIPGFYPMYNSAEGNESYLIARGHPQKYANTVLLLINGKRINEDYTGGINYLVRFISLHNVEKVEIIRGPGSTLYGSNAFNGVVNLITKTDNYIELSTGSFGQRQLNAGFHYDSEQLTIGFDAHLYKDNGDSIGNVFDRFGLQTSTNDERQVQQFEFLLSSYGVTFNTRYQQSKRDNFYIFRRLRDGVATIDIDHFLSSIEYSNSYKNTLGFNAAIEYTKGHRKSVTALEIRGQQPFIDDDFLFGENFTYESYRAIIDGYYKYSDKHQLSAGVEFVQSHVPGGFIRSNYNIFNELEYLGKIVDFKQPEQRIVLDKTRRIKMAYIQLESTWSEQFRTTIGVRRDTYNDIDGRTNPRAAILYSLNKHHLIKFLYGEAYRVPSLGDLYDEESGLTIGNRSLKPTTLKSTEFVYQYLSEKVKISTSIFKNKIDDIIDFSTDGTNVFLGNVAANKTTGIEIEWQSQLSDNMQLEGSITHLFSNKTYVEPGQNTALSKSLVPRTHSMTSLIVNLENRWQGSLSIHGRSSVDVIHSEANNWFVSSKIQYRVNESSVISLDINNLLNSHFDTGSIVPLGETNEKVYSSFEVRGREIALSFSHRF